MNTISLGWSPCDRLRLMEAAFDGVLPAAVTPSTTLAVRNTMTSEPGTTRPARSGGREDSDGDDQSLADADPGARSVGNASVSPEPLPVYSKPVIAAWLRISSVKFE